MTFRQLGEAYLKDWKDTRGDRRSPQTVEAYEEVWRIYLYPLLGDLLLPEIRPEVVQSLKSRIPELVVERRPHAKQGGRVIANRALQQGSAAFDHAFRMGWVTGNPFSEKIVYRYQEEPDGYAFDPAEMAAIGQALQELEELAKRPRHPLPYRSIAGIRLLLLTGARPNELCPAVTEQRYAEGFTPFCVLDDPHPRIRIQRAKGDRGNQKRAPGRLIWLPPPAVEIIRKVPRVPGDIHLLPGDIPGEHVQRLNSAWRAVLKVAQTILPGLPMVPLKTTRHTFRTYCADAGVTPEHTQQLMGHAGLKVTDTVYLHMIAPTLAAAAARAAECITARLDGRSWERAAPEPYAPVLYHPITATPKT